MPGSAGSTSELYIDQDNPASTLGAPPSAPAPVPPPTQPVRVTEPVVTKSRMADETPDGRVRDTSTEALQPSRDLGFRNLTDESENAPKPKPEEIAPPAEAKPAEQPPAEGKPADAVAEKVYAGKFKTPEDLEKGYLEAQKEMHKKAERAAELERQLTAQANKPPVEVAPKTPAQIAAQEAEKNKFLEKFVSDPEGVIKDYQQQAIQQTQVALATQQVRNEWLMRNPDLVEHEARVAFEMAQLVQTDPELAKDPGALLGKATENFRQFTGKIRTEGMKEALTTETRVVPLLNSTAQTAATEQPSTKAPLTSDQAYDLTLKMLKEQEQRSKRGLRR